MTKEKLNIEVIDTDVFGNEDRCYRPPRFTGGAMLLEAIDLVGKSESVPTVLSDYRLTCKAIKLHELM